MSHTGPAARWRDALRRWAIPDRILRAAPSNPHEFSVHRFTQLADEAVRQPPTATHRRAAAALPHGGTVLDVGCGGGAGSLPLADRAALLIGVDQSAGMLAAFAEGARRLGVAAQTVEGIWPDAAADTPVADVVVCLHVVYNVADLVPFAEALTAHARRRVVLELPTRHPLHWLNPYWRVVHGVERPDGPTADDALAVFSGLGYAPRHERWQRPVSVHDATLDDQVTFIGQRLAVADDHRRQVRDAVHRFGIPAERDVVTVWWDI